MALPALPVCGSAAPPLPAAPACTLPDLQDLPDLPDLLDLPSVHEFFPEISLAAGIEDDELMPDLHFHKSAVETTVEEAFLKVDNISIGEEQIDKILKQVRRHLKRKFKHKPVKDDARILEIARKLGFNSCADFSAAKLPLLKQRARDNNVCIESIIKSRNVLSSRRSAKTSCGNVLARYLVKLLIVSSINN